MKKIILGIVFCLLCSINLNVNAKEPVKNIKYYNKLILKEPNNAQNYYERGKLYYFKRKPQEAISDLTIATELDEKLYDAYYYKSAIYLIENEIGLAYEELSDLIKLNPKYKSAYMLRSFIYFYIHDYENEIKDITTAIKVDPDDIYLYRIRAHAYYSNKEFNKAVKDITKYIDKVQNMRDLAFGFSFRSDCYFALNKKDEALKDWNSAIQLDRRYERDIVKFEKLQNL